MAANRICVRSILAMTLVVSVLRAQSTENLMASGLDMLRNGAYDRAAAHFNQVLQRNPGNFEAQYNLGLTYLMAQNYDAALGELKKAAGMEQSNPEVWANMGVAYERLGNTPQAMSSFKKAVNLDPANLEARLNLAAMLANQDQINEAITQFKQIVMIDGSNAVALNNLSNLLLRKNQVKEAKQYLREAIAADPGNAEAHWLLGNILMENEKNLEDAVKEYRHAVRKEPDTQLYYYNLGVALENLGRTAEAIEVYDSYLVHLNDALKKEEVEKRIEWLKNPVAKSGDAPAGGGGPQSSQKAKTKELEKELRPQDTKEEPRTMDVGDFKVETDLENLFADDPDEADPLDLASEAKKRAKK